MRTEIESRLIFALLSKCNAITQQNLTCSLLLLVLLCFAMALLQWAVPGGPAWGRYFLKNHNFVSLLRNIGNKKYSTMIPGPRGIPLIGSMRLMSSHVAHHRIADEARRRGAERLMAFSLGETCVVVTCHPEVAKEILNSPVFADRPVKESARVLMFGRAIGFAPHGTYWRTLRQMAANHMFNPRQIRAAASQRQEIASRMVNELGELGELGSCHVREVIKTASLNNMMGSVFGREYRLGCENREVEELRELIDEGYDLLGTLNWTDHISWLSEFDPQRIRFRCRDLVPKVNRFVNRILTEHRNKTGSDNSPRDFVDVLLSLQGPHNLSDVDVIAVLWEMIFRGTDTVAVLIEWILARMVLHPHVQSTVHDELDKVVGRSRAVDESDVASLTYLTAVIKEVLRLHPPGPLLSWARLAITDTTIDGHQVPAGTTAMVNMWAIARDPATWPYPLEFRPERFGEGKEFSVLGSDLRLAPFGSGRRVCPGKNLGMETVAYFVATLLHEFEWTAAGEDSVDLSENLKLTCEMAHPLVANVRPRRRVGLKTE